MTKKHFFLSSRLSLLNHKHTPGLSWSAGKVSYLPVKATAIGFKDLDVCPGLKYLPHVQDKPDFRRDGGGSGDSLRNIFRPVGSLGKGVAANSNLQCSYVRKLSPG